MVNTKYMLAVLALLLFATPAFAENNFLSLARVSTSPSVIHPGDDVMLTFYLYNTWAYSAQQVSVQLQGSKPLLQTSPSEAQLVQFVGSNGTLSTPVSFKLHIDDNADAGSYTLNVVNSFYTLTETRVSTSSVSTVQSQRTETTPLTLTIRGRPKMIVSQSLMPAKIEPNTLATAQLQIINDGSDGAQNLRLFAQSTPTFSILGSSQFDLGKLETGKSAGMNLQFQSAQELAAGTYILPLIFTYEDNYGANYTQTVELPIVVSVDEPKLQVDVISSQPDKLRPGDSAQLTLSVWNRGQGTAKDVRLAFPNSGLLRVLSASGEVPVGTVQPDQRVPVNVGLEISADAQASAQALPYTIDYTNANEQQTFSKNGSMRIALDNAAIFRVLNATGFLYPGVKYRQVGIVIKNAGAYDARELKLSLNTQYPLSPSGRDQFVPLIKAGETTTVYFHVDVDSGAAAQSYPVEIFLAWKEGSNRIYTTTKSYALDVQPEPVNWGLWGAILLAIGAIFYLAYWKKKRTLPPMHAPQAQQLQVKKAR